MLTFYDKKGKYLGEAYSAELGPCNKKEEHKPHSYNPEFACYGPYMCEGVPAVKLFTTKPRKPVN